MAELYLRQDAMGSTERVKDDNPLPIKTIEDGPGPASIETGQPSMSSTATQIAPAREKKRILTIVNIGAGTFAVGPEGRSSTTGFQLVSGASKTFYTRAAIFGICATSVTSTASYSDEFDV